MSNMTLPGGAGIRFIPIRSIEKRAAEEGADAVYEVAVSSEYEVTRDFYGMKWREVLDHNESSIKLDRFKSGRAAVLEEHRGVPIGVIDAVRVDDDKVMRCDIRFSRSTRGQEAKNDVEDGIRTNISVGYVPTRAILEEEDSEKGDLYRFVEWEPVELSLVGIPADPTVGLGRDMGGAGYPPCIVERRTNKEERSMMNGRKFNEGGAGGNGAAPAAAPASPQPEVRAEAGAAPHLKEMAAIAEANGCGHRFAEWVQQGVNTTEALVRKVLEHVQTNGVPTKPEKQVGTERDLRGYKYARAILGAALMAEGKPFTGLEAEVHQEMERDLPAAIERRGGVLVPFRLSPEGQRNTRALSSNAGTKGAEVVFEQQGELIDILRNRTAVIGLGARVLTGLTAPIAFPKQTAQMVAQWVGENPGTDVTDSDIALTLALMNPKTLQASTAYSRQLLVTASIDTEGMVRDEFGLVHGIAADRAAIHGLGAAGEPTGVYKAVGVTPKPFGGLASYSLLLDMQGAVASLNADLGALGYLMNPTMATNLRKTLDFPAAAAGRPIWTGTYQNGEVGGYKAVATNQVSANMSGSERTGGSEYGCIFGNWNDVIIGGYGGLELVVDPYRLKKQGLIEVTSFQMLDILVRRGESFCKSTGATG